MKLLLEKRKFEKNPNLCNFQGLETVNYVFQNHKKYPNLKPKFLLSIFDFFEELLKNKNNPSPPKYVQYTTAQFQNSITEKFEKSTLETHEHAFTEQNFQVFIK